MKPVRATYGAYDNSHKLLYCNSQTAKLPPELEGLTDRPPGDIAPGEVWWPSIGCGAVGDWWCLWWTKPDLNAERAGMVLSEVALWPLAEIGALEDLSPILCELSGIETFEPASESNLIQVAEVLMTNQEVPIVVCDCLDVLPRIIAGLWQRLWPEARMNFSSRVAISPPQNSTSSKPPWFFGVPASRKLQWQQPYKKIELGTQQVNLVEYSRAAQYLSGRIDKTMADIIEAIPPRQSDLLYLARVARAADSLEKMKFSQNYEDAISLLRTLIALAPFDDEASHYKQHAITTIAQAMEDASSLQITAIANILLPPLPSKSELEQSLQNWVLENAAKIDVSESTILLNKLHREKAQPWWQSSVRDGLRKGIATFDKVWALAVLNWLTVRDLDSVLAELIKAPNSIEGKLIEAAKEKHWTKVDIDHLRDQSVKRKWPILHAWCLAQSMSASDAFDAQYSFVGESFPGLEFLVHNLPANDVVKAVVSRDDSDLATLIAQLTIQHPELLRWLDISKPSSRLIWATHVELGDRAWPEIFQANEQGRKLLDAAISGEESHCLVATFASDLSQVTVDHPRRKELWERLTLPESREILSHVAKAFIERLNANQKMAQPEPVLANAIVEILRRSRPSAWAVCTILSWDITFSEHEVNGWISQFTGIEWRSVAPEIGRIVFAKKWRKVTGELNSIWRSIPEATPAAEACRALLSRWDQFMFVFSGCSTSKPTTLQDQTTLINRVAEIGSDLQPDALDEIWERAGGQIKHLESRSTPSARWQIASKLAANGALPEKLLSLVCELKENFPKNDQLIELESVLRNIEEK